jgi:hypothetical protein
MSADKMAFLSSQSFNEGEQDAHFQGNYFMFAVDFLGWMEAG